MKLIASRCLLLILFCCTVLYAQTITEYGNRIFNANVTVAGTCTGCGTGGSLNVNVQTLGAIADLKTDATASITSGSAALVTTSSRFVSGDATTHKWILVHAAGAAAADLITTISTFTDANHVTLATTASTTVASAGIIVWSTNNTTALNTALASACSANLPLYFPGAANPYGTDSLNTISGCNMSLIGDGPLRSIVRAIGNTASGSATLFNFSNTSAIQNSFYMSNIAFDGTKSGVGNNKNWTEAGVSVNAYNSVRVDTVSFSNFGVPGYNFTNGGGHTGAYDGLYVINSEYATFTNVTSTGNERDGIETQAIHHGFVTNAVTANDGRFGFVAEQNFTAINGSGATTDGPGTITINGISCTSNGDGCTDVETDSALPVATEEAKGIVGNGDGNDPWGTTPGVSAPPANCFEWDMAIGHAAQGSITNSTSINFATGVTYTCPAQQVPIYVINPGGPFILANNTVIGSGYDGIQVSDANAKDTYIVGNRVTNSAHDGIFAYDMTSNSIIANNTISKSTVYGLEMQLGSGAGVYANVITRSGTASVSLAGFGTWDGVQSINGDITPSIVAGTGAGTSPTVTITAGHTNSGLLNITTGTGSPATAAILATVTFAGTLPVAPSACLIEPANAATGALAVAANPFVSSTSTTTFVVTTGGTALAASTAYKWWYHCF